jgi:PKD repeat protein
MNSRFVSRGKATIVALLALLAAPGAAQTPLNGCYLVNAGAATDFPTGINFANWADAKAALDANGLNGAVTFFLVETGVGPGGGDFNVTQNWRPLVNFAGYAGGTAGAGGAACFVLDEWTGRSATNTITIKSIPGSPRIVCDATAGGTLTNPLPGTPTSIIPVGVFYQGADFVTIEDIEFKNFTREAFALYGEATMQVLPKDGVALNNTIRRCYVHNVLGSAVMMYGNTSRPSGTVIENCVFANCMLGTGVAEFFNAFGRFGHISGRRLDGAIVRHNTFYQDQPMVLAPINGTQAALPQCFVGCNSNTGTAFSVVSGNLFMISDQLAANGGAPAITTPAFYRWFAPANLNNPTSADFNLFFDNSNSGVGSGVFASRQGVNTATLAAYQTASAQEGSSIYADPQFNAVATLDLGILPTSPAVDAGLAGSVANDNNGNPRIGLKPDCGALEAPLPGLVAAFKADLGAGPCGPIEVLDGPAPLTVFFTDQSTNIGGPAIASWDWDFENDGVDDVTGSQNPTHTYLQPGTYSVKMTINDGATSANIVRTAYVVVRPYPLVVASTGGDLFLQGVPQIGLTTYPTTPPALAFGYTFMSFNTLGTLGAGSFVGITFDAVSQLTLTWPLGPGDPLRWFMTGTPGVYPEIPFTLPPLTMYFLGFAPGLTVDFVQLYTDAGNNYLVHTNAARVTF